MLLLSEYGLKDICMVIGAYGGVLFPKPWSPFLAEYEKVADFKKSEIL